jgi:hypothetical protein
MYGMKKSTFEVLNDPKTGLKYVSKCEDELIKNHRTNDRESTSGVMPEFPGSPYCPVKSFEMYISKLHPLCTSLWQRPKESFSDDDTVWYCNSRLGEKTLSKFMTKLSEGAKLSQIYTNHSIRAIGTKILIKSMFNPSQIMAVTGHKSVQSLTGYQKTDIEEKIAMGHAMGKSLTPQNSAVLALPPPENSSLFAMPSPATTVKECTSIVPIMQECSGSAAISESQGLNISDLFTDFPSSSLQTETNISNVQNKPILPAFSGCTIGTIIFNFNVSK